MRLHKVQAVGVGILAWLAVLNAAGTAQGAGLTLVQRERADTQAERALAYTTTEPRAFRVCIRSGYRVYTQGVFIGRACRAADGERWFAGMSWSGGQRHLVTGP